MTKEQMDDIVADSGGNVEPYEGYSGRFMYGKKTYAVTGDYFETVEAIVRAGYTAKDFRQDQLGLGVIFY